MKKLQPLLTRAETKDDRYYLKIACHVFKLSAFDVVIKFLCGEKKETRSKAVSIQSGL